MQVMGIKAAETGYGGLVRNRLEWLSTQLHDLEWALAQLRDGGPDDMCGPVIARIKAVKDEQAFWVGWLAGEINDDRLAGLL